MGDQESEIEDLERVFNTAKATPIKISYGALRLITQNFAQVIGSGTFGLVYLVWFCQVVKLCNSMRSAPCPYII